MPFLLKNNISSFETGELLVDWVEKFLEKSCDILIENGEISATEKTSLLKKFNDKVITKEYLSGTFVELHGFFHSLDEILPILSVEAVRIHAENISDNGADE